MTSQNTNMERDFCFLFTLALAFTNLPCLSCTLYTVRPERRLNADPLSSSSGQISFGYCLMKCRLTNNCHSVNVKRERVGKMVTCEFLGMYLHEMPEDLQASPNWFFIQEDPVYPDPPYALAFRVSAGTGLSVWNKWKQDGRHDDANMLRNCVLPAGSLPCTSHFRSYILDHWTNIDQVRMTLYKDGKKGAQLIFDGKGSNRTSWLDHSRLLYSTWIDMTYITPNIFSVEGMDGILRRFYLSVSNDGCEYDVGWLVVADFHRVDISDQCRWEKVNPLPAILYSPSQTATNWNNTFTTADFMMIDVTFEK